MKYLLCVALLLSGSQLFAQTDEPTDQPDWIYVCKKTNGLDKFYMKSTCVSANDHVIKIWVKDIAASFTYSGRTYRNVSTETLYEFDCSGRQLQIDQAVTYDSEGNTIESYEYEDYERKWTDVVPGSIGEMLLNEACQLFNNQ